MTEYLERHCSLPVYENAQVSRNRLKLVAKAVPPKSGSSQAIIPPLCDAPILNGYFTFGYRVHDHFEAILRNCIAYSRVFEGIPESES